MCLAIPMKIIEIEDENNAYVELNGVKNKIDISLLEDVKIGDYVIVHTGFAIEKLDKEEAQETLSLFQQILEAEDNG